MTTAKMGLTNESAQDLEMHSVRDEESLPLYSEVAPDTVPEPDATPDAVREFFKTLLVTKRQESPENAEAVANLWTRGSGQELKSYPPAMYLKIFGNEDGWFLYRETQLMRRRKKHEESKVDKGFKYTMPFVALAWVLGMLAIFLWSGSAGWMTFAIFAGLFGLVVLGVSVGIALDIGTLSLEDQIEGELRKCMEKVENHNNS